MGSIFSREGRGGGGGGGGEEKSVLCLAYEPRRRLLDRDRIRIIEEKKEKEKRGGITIFISAITFILVREITTELIERKRREENEDDPNSSSSSSSSSSCSYLCDELQLLIMSKVPTHSLVKFMRVSKTWRSWINKGDFFLGKCSQPRRTDGFFFVHEGRNPNSFTYTPLPINEEEDLYPPSTSLLPFPTINSDGAVLSFDICLNSSNGLLLLSTFRDHRTVELLVHNPLTRQSLLVPREESQKFAGKSSWIGYEPTRSPAYFNVVHLAYVCPSLVLQIFSSRSWTWRDLFIDVAPVYSSIRSAGKAVTTDDGRMFIDLTFLYSLIVLIVHLDRTGEEDYVIVSLPPGLPPPLIYGDSAVGMSQGNMMYAYTHDGVLLVYKLLHPIEQGGDYQWTLLMKDTSLPDRIASKAGCTAFTYQVDAQDFLLHMPVLLISADCTRRHKIFLYNFTNGSLLELFESDDWMDNITPLTLCPLGNLLL